MWTFRSAFSINWKSWSHRLDEAPGEGKFHHYEHTGLNNAGPARGHAARTARAGERG